MPYLKLLNNSFLKIKMNIKNPLPNNSGKPFKTVFFFFFLLVYDGNN